MSAITYGAGFVILIVASILYERYKEKDITQKRIEDYEYIKNYLLNESTLAKCKKPILWIPIQFEYNARHWHSFGSRSNTCLNKPYMTLCIKSIIDHCGDDFQVCLIDDSTFNKILPGWNAKINFLPDPLRDHLRYLALSKMLYYYGGMVVPPSFICLRNMKSIYNMGLSRTSMFCGEFSPESEVSSITNFFPSMKLMGCDKDSPIMKAFIEYLERAVSSDYTEELEFTGGPERWLFRQVVNKNILLIDGKFLGVKDINSNPIALEVLLGNINARFNKKMVGLYVPDYNLTRRTNFNWFERLSYKQVLESETIIGKYLLISNSQNN